MSEVEYSPISNASVVSVLLGALASLGFVFPELVIVAIPGIAVGVAAIHNIKKHSLAGKRFADAGITSSLIFAICAPIWHAARYNSETIPGYKRMDFADITVAGNAGMESLVGSNVCLKGYALWPGQSGHVQTFRFSPQGDWRNANKDLVVNLPFEWDPIYDAIAISGTIVRNPKSDPAAEAPKYIMQGRQIRMARSHFGLAGRRGGC